MPATLARNLRDPGRVRAVVGWAGVVLHVAVGVFPYSASGLLAPGYGVALLWGCWAVLLMVALRVRRRRPLWVPAIPAAALLVWWTVMSVGGALLGWTA